MLSRLLWTVFSLATLGALGGFAVSRFSLPPAHLTLAAPPQPLRQAPEFRLIDQDRRPFSSETLRDRVWIADFIFTSCAGTCPEMSRKMSGLQAKLPAQIQLVSFSVDPVRDSPEALNAYAKRYKAQTGRWHFLTGSPRTMAQLVQQGFALSIAEGGRPEEPITHSVRFVLVDAEGKIRGYYDSTEPQSLEKLQQDALALLE